MWHAGSSGAPNSPSSCRRNTFRSDRTRAPHADAMMASSFSPKAARSIITAPPAERPAHGHLRHATLHEIHTLKASDFALLFLLLAMALVEVASALRRERAHQVLEGLDLACRHDAGHDR